MGGIRMHSLRVLDGIVGHTDLTKCCYQHRLTPAHGHDIDGGDLGGVSTGYITISNYLTLETGYTLEAVDLSIYATDNAVDSQFFVAHPDEPDITKGPKGICTAVVNQRCLWSGPVAVDSQNRIEWFSNVLANSFANLEITIKGLFYKPS